MTSSDRLSFDLAFSLIFNKLSKIILLEPSIIGLIIDGNMLIMELLIASSIELFVEVVAAMLLDVWLEDVCANRLVACVCKAVPVCCEDTLMRE